MIPVRSFLIIVAVLLLPVPALAADDPAKKTPLDHVEALATYVAQDDADFDGGSALYKAARAALAEEAETVEKPEDRVAAARYAEIQERVANVMRRESVPVMAWVMGLFGAFLLWGGFFFCLGVARKSGGGKGDG